MPSSKQQSVSPIQYTLAKTKASTSSHPGTFTRDSFHFNFIPRVSIQEQDSKRKNWRRKWLWNHFNRRSRIKRSTFTLNSSSYVRNREEVKLNPSRKWIDFCTQNQIKARKLTELELRREHVLNLFSFLWFQSLVLLLLIDF